MLGNVNIPAPLRKLVKLYLLDARLAVTQRLAALMSSLITGLFIVLLFIAAIIFGSIAVATELRHVMSPSAAYGIVAAFYIVLLLIIVVFKKQLIVNPISRMLSRAILPDPTEDENK